MSRRGDETAVYYMTEAARMVAAAERDPRLSGGFATAAVRLAQAALLARTLEDDDETLDLPADWYKD